MCNPSISNENDLLQHLSKMKPGAILSNLNVALKDINGNTQDLTGSTVLCRERHSTKKPGKQKGSYRYEVFSQNHLGQGGFGKVFPIHATLRLNKDNKIEILKKENNKQRVVKISNENQLSSIKRESKWGQTIPYLHMKPEIESTAASDNGKAYYLVMHRMPGSTLRQLMEAKTIGHLDWDKKLMLLLSLLQALQDLHKQKLIHEDIKPDNIMVNFEPGNAKPQTRIIDFGSCKQGGLIEIDGNVTYIARYKPDPLGAGKTPQYMAREAYNTTRFGIHSYEASDVYSLGVVFSEIMTQGQISDPQLDKIVQQMRESDDEQRIALDKAIRLYSDWMLQPYQKIARLKLDLLNNLNANPAFSSILKSQAISLTAEQLIDAEKELKNLTDGNQAILIDLNEKLNLIKVLDFFKQSQHNKLGETLIACFQLFTNIAGLSEVTTINALQLSVIQAIFTYVKKTYRSHSHDRAASDRRINNINDLLTILNDKKEEGALQEAIIDWNKTIKKGGLGRSALYDLVAQAANIPLSKSYFGSSLWFKLKNPSSLETHMQENCIQNYPDLNLKK